jgi:TetR/AcrR family transcriptional regulator, copper-responsive repressor
MGRPRKFTRDSVIEKAMPVFWTHGFAATSVQDLEQATGVNKSGLYAEFNGKEDLFLACFRHYFETRIGQHILRREPPGWDNIQQFLEQAPGNEAGQVGCFSINSLREMNDLPPAAREIMRDNRRLLDALITRNIEAERPRMAPDAVCEVVDAFFSGLCIECNLEAEPVPRERLIASFMAMLRAL